MTTTTEFPSAVAKARFVRVSPTKARRVIDLVRGKSVADALDILRWAPQAASEPVAKVIASAAANAQNNNGLGPGDSGGRHRLRRRRTDRQAHPSARPGPRVPDSPAHQPHHGRGGKPAGQGSAVRRSRRGPVAPRPARPPRKRRPRRLAAKAPAKRPPRRRPREGAGQKAPSKGQIRRSRYDSF